MNKQTRLSAHECSIRCRIPCVEGSINAKPNQHVYPDEVLIKLMQITGDNPRQKCVIVCVDDLQMLHEVLPHEKPLLQSALTSLVSSSGCWVIVIASASIYQPINGFLTASNQWVRHLPTARLSRPKVRRVDGFEAFGDEGSMQLLVDAMGEVGKWLEESYSVLQQI